MPIKISLPFDPDKVEKVIHYWLDLLTKDDYTETYNLTEHDPYYEWTPASIEVNINGYGLPYEEGNIKQKVTNWRDVDNGAGNPMDILLFDNPQPDKKKKFKRIGIAQYDLPMNRERSDLTVIFTILQADKYFTLELNDIHVM